jgi:hypothetical protein
MERSRLQTFREGNPNSLLKLGKAKRSKMGKACYPGLIPKIEKVEWLQLAREKFPGSQETA